VLNASPTFLALRDDPEGPVAEAYRSLRANLKFVLAQDERIRVLAFTSCSQGEGKSVTNIDVALAFALGGKRVLLVDADMRRPVVARYLGLPNVPGLSEILSGSARWQECVQETHVPQLGVIAAGRQPRTPGDLLAGDACEQLIDELRGAYDLVVFDVPPALAVADTEAFASRLDAVVLLARSRRLTRTVLSRTAGRLRGAGANLIGCVLNADRPNRSESKYGYGYGYGYGSGPARGERGDHAGRRETVHSSRAD
jgi:capsular exopolysaccharide synthesis family protein